MKARYLILALAVSCATAAANAQETARFKQINRDLLTPHSKIIMVAAHRGVHNDCPENSMTAFRKGIELGIDVVELDVRHTKDDSLVVMHDATVNRTTNGKGAVADLSFEEVRKLRLTYKGKVTEEQVPTLAEALSLMKGKILVDLDIKTDRIAAILSVVERSGAINSCLFFIGEPAHCKMLKERNTACKTLVRTHSAAEVDSLFAITTTEAVHIDDSHYTKAVTEKIKNKGARVWANALGDTDKAAASGNLKVYSQLLENGADMIQTDQPALLLEYLKQQKLH